MHILRNAIMSLTLVTGCATASLTLSPAETESELAQAKALFEKNLKAIVDKDRETYLSCYRQDDRLVMTGPEGMRDGFQALADETEANEWPQSIERTDLEVRWIAPGVVYGTYRYRVVFDGVEATGISERVFLKQGDRWIIAVSTAFDTPE